MKHLKIRVKLLLGFALVSVLAVIVGLVGTFGLASTDRRYREMLDISISGISSMADMRENFLQQRYLLRSIILDIQQDPEKIEDDIYSIKMYEAKMADAMAAYENTITDQDAEQNYYMAKDAYLNAFLAASRKIVDAARLGDFETAMEALAEGGQPAGIITEGIQGTVDYINGSVETDLYNLARRSTQTTVIQAVVVLLAVVCAMALGRYIASIISKPLAAMSDFFVRFGTSGDLTLSEEDEKDIASHSKNRDEIGRCISGAVKMIIRLKEINEKLVKVADGDLNADMKALSEKDSLGIAMTKVIDSLNTVLGELRAASGQVSAGSGQIAQGAQELASGSSQQAASIEEFANSLTDLQEKTQNNADSSADAEKVIGEMGSRIDESVSSMRQMMEAMKGIDESSKNITRVIKVIDDIAFQTNILALNAAVEAARAGLHGKGFAVVADEVRNLASKSAAAAKETADLIEGSSEKVNEGNNIVNKTNVSLEAVAEGSKEAVRLIDKVSAASAEQAGAIKEMRQNIEQISNVVQENSASAQESAAASEEMSSQAALLNEIAARFKLKASGGADDARGANRQPSPDKTAPDTETNDESGYEKYR